MNIVTRAAAVALAVAITVTRAAPSRAGPTTGPAAPAGATAETPARRDARLQWWRDAKFGLFVHWSPCAISGKELSWSRPGPKPLDITGSPAGAVPEPGYDDLYKRFNPTAFDAARWVQIARDAGMRYVVLTCKHHEGFSMFDTRWSDHNIMRSPFGRDVVRELADACHAAGMRFGVYYSQRDWFNPAYGIGDNRKYVEFMNGQLRELLTNYGKVDVVWFDSYGRGDLVRFWQIGRTWNLVKSLQPDVIVNNRLAVLGEYGRQPVPYRGDFDTPEQAVGRMQTDRPWESCMCLVGHQWSWQPGGQMQPLADVLRDLVGCATGDGNLLLDVGPMPTGAIEPRQVARLTEVGDWLRTHGESVYATRGGPLRNGSWGGTTYRGNTVYLHVFHWPGGTLRLNPIDERVMAARVLTGGNVTFLQTATGIDVTVPDADRDPVDTVVVLTLDRPVTHLYNMAARRSMFEDPGYGGVISGDATLTISSASKPNDRPADHASLFTGRNGGYAFHTDTQAGAWAVIDLGKVKTVTGVRITNRPHDGRAAGLIVSTSEDGRQWNQAWQAEAADEVWEAAVTQTVAGASVPGRRVRYVKLQLPGDHRGPLLLRQADVFGRD